MSSTRGLSPRGRGNPTQSSRALLHPGSIPAWAGEPGLAVAGREFNGVYPRVGGGTASPAVELSPVMGLSPRGRGNPPTTFVYGLIHRSIPAWAGEPCLPYGQVPCAVVYPRVGGGTLSSLWASAMCSGLSPRGRGNPYWNPQASITCRSIPAWAGEPRPPLGRCHHRRVYPRVGGGTAYRGRVSAGADGLSPRGRGNP